MNIKKLGIVIVAATVGVVVMGAAVSALTEKGTPPPGGLVHVDAEYMRKALESGEVEPPVTASPVTFPPGDGKEFFKDAQPAVLDPEDVALLRPILTGSDSPPTPAAPVPEAARLATANAVAKANIFVGPRIQGPSAGEVPLTSIPGSPVVEAKGNPPISAPPIPAPSK
jgi:hypothetical protein